MNKFESEIIESIKRILIIIPRKSISVKGDEAIKLYDNSNKMFIQPRSPYCSPFGYQKRNDISLYCPKLNIDWRIECKFRETNGLLGEIIRELNFITNIPEKLYCLVMTDNILTPYFRRELNQNVQEKGLGDKVWIGNKCDFEALLIKQKLITF
jgi:hypothetical protein